MSTTIGSSAEMQPSLQLADVIIVATDTRGFALARTLAERGWKTVVLELAGGMETKALDWADRLGPFLSWEQESGEVTGLRSQYPALWLPSGPVTFAGPMSEAGAKHLQTRYGVGADEGWPIGLFRSAISTRLMRRERFMSRDANDLQKLPMTQPVKSLNHADSIATKRRELAIAAGVRVLDASQITGVRLSDRTIDRVEFTVTSYDAKGMQQTTPMVERTRSLVWMLSEEESRKVEYVGADVPLESFFNIGTMVPGMAWWRARLAVRGLKDAKSEALTRLPEVPPVTLVVGAVERPWTHDNLIALEMVERSDSMLVFDAWIRVPHWSRADHVYRDEQRLLMHERLQERFVGCELVWVTPSPLALTDPAVRLPHTLYLERSKPATGKLRNICFAGPETWSGVGLFGLKPMESLWIEELERMRRLWDPAATPQGPIEKLRRLINKPKYPNDTPEVSP